MDLTQDAGTTGKQHSRARSTLLETMTEDELRFSYGVVLSAEAHRQLGREMDGSLMTCLVAVQKDVEAVKADILSANK